MRPTLVLVAERGRARLFAWQRRNEAPTELESFVNPEGQMHETSLTSDLPGSNAGADGSHHRVGAEWVRKDRAAEVFAPKLAERLDDARKRGEGRSFFLVAPPGFLGLLRSRLSAETTKMVEREIGRNLVRLPIEKLQEHLEPD